MLLGFSNSKILWNGEKRQWEIWDLYHNRIGAKLNTTLYFPLGTHSWYFYPYVECHDERQKTRNLNLHIATERPGKFCCRDGTVVDSELVCDGDHNCHDKSDEFNCQLVQTNPGYINSTPPKIEGNNKVNWKKIQFSWNN